MPAVRKRCQKPIYYGWQWVGCVCRYESQTNIKRQNEMQDMLKVRKHSHMVSNDKPKQMVVVREYPQKGEDRHLKNAFKDKSRQELDIQVKIGCQQSKKNTTELIQMTNNVRM